MPRRLALMQAERNAPNPLDAPAGLGYSPPSVGDVLQGAAADCNSAEATRAWFDSRVAHHNKINDLI